MLNYPFFQQNISKQNIGLTVSCEHFTWQGRHFCYGNWAGKLNLFLRLKYILVYYTSKIDLTTVKIPLAVMLVLRWLKWVPDAYIICPHRVLLKYGTQNDSPVWSPFSTVN